MAKSTITPEFIADLQAVAVQEHAVHNEREAIAVWIETHKSIWGKNAAEAIRRGDHIQR